MHLPLSLNHKGPPVMENQEDESKHPKERKNDNLL